MHTATERTVGNMRRAAATLSEMLAHTVAQTRRLQRLQEKAWGRPYASGEELKQDYDPDEMKDLTALLKDIATVTKALDERDSGSVQQQPAGVLVLPAAQLESAAAQTEENCLDAENGAAQTAESGGEKETERDSRKENAAAG